MKATTATCWIALTFAAATVEAMAGGWPTRTGGSQADIARAIVVDSAENVYVLGDYRSRAVFGTIPLTFTDDDAVFIPPVDSRGDQDLLLGKLDPNGNWLWAVAAGGVEADEGLAMAVDTEGHVFVAGSFRGVAQFGRLEVTAASAEESDIFVAKLDTSNTNWAWVVRAGGVGADVAYDLALDDTGHILLTGSFTGEAAFGPTTLSGLGQDVVIAKLDPQGKWSWALKAGGNALDEGRAIVADREGTDRVVYVAGAFGGTAAFGSANLVSEGSTDLFVSKLIDRDIAAEWVWSVQSGGAQLDEASSLAVDAAGFVYVQGEIGANAVFTGRDGTTFNLNASDPSVFAARLTTDGFYNWVRVVENTANAGSLVVDNNGSVFASGDANGLFVQKLSASTGVPQWTETVSGQVSGVDLDRGPSGDFYLAAHFAATLPIGVVDDLTSRGGTDMVFAKLRDGGSAAAWINQEWTLGTTIPRPAGTLPQVPQIEVHSGGGNFSSGGFNSFFWSEAEKKLYAVRPIGTVRINWLLPFEIGDTNFQSKIFSYGGNIWPDDAPKVVADVPVTVEREGLPYTFLEIRYNTSGASVDGQKIFRTTQAGRNVIIYLFTDGQAPDPVLHPPSFEIFETVAWDDTAVLTDAHPALIGEELSGIPFGHHDPEGKNGYAFFRRGPYDGLIYDRDRRVGQIIPVNHFLPGTGLNEEMVVVWFDTNEKDIGWPIKSVRYDCRWPDDAEKIIISSPIGSDVLGQQKLDPLVFPGMHPYIQPNSNNPGYNPNDEHAFLAPSDVGDAFYALRNDLTSEPFALLKHVDPVTQNWKFRVYQVLAEGGQGSRVWAETAGGPAPDQACAVAVNDAGDVYVVGAFRGRAEFGVHAVRSSGLSDIFVAKMDGTFGQWVWVTNAGGQRADSGLAIDVEGDNLYITGQFEGAAKFGDTELVSSNDTSDIFVAKIVDEGLRPAWSWAVSVSSSGEDGGRSIAVDSDKIFLTAAFAGTAVFKPDTGTPISLRPEERTAWTPNSARPRKAPTT